MNIRSDHWEHLIKQILPTLAECSKTIIAILKDYLITNGLVNRDNDVTQLKKIFDVPLKQKQKCSHVPHFTRFSRCR